MDLQVLTENLVHYRYEILIPLSVVEGPLVAVATGALASHGYFSVLEVFAIFLLKDLIVDGAYFWLGRSSRWSARANGLLAKLRFGYAHIERVREEWDAHGWRTMLVGKLAWGLAPAVLATAGFVGVSTSTFFGYAAAVAAAQYVVLLALGYYLGSAMALASLGIRVIGYAAAVTTVVAIIALRRRWQVRSEEALDGVGNLLRSVEHDDVIGVADDDELGPRNET
jgi:membrane protein DedA with SNARE-associated domain